MRKFLLLGSLVIGLLTSSITFGQTSSLNENEVWSIKMADSVMKSHSRLAENWNYEFGLMLKAIEQVWRKTNDPKYLDYIKQNIDRFVDKKGNIKTYYLYEYSLDQINAGKMLLFLSNQTGDLRYKTAAYLIREQLKTHPRNSEGGFWHKKIYPDQMWLDGLYMEAPFYVEFAKMFNEPSDFDDAAQQIILIYQQARDPKTGLLYHGWDESKKQQWANQETGCSSNFWGRAMGWYVMAIVDVLDYLPENHPKRNEIIRIFNDTIIALTAVQDQKTGLWYQVLNQGDRKGNYLEASASCMIVYAIAKGVNRAYLDPKYKDKAEKGYEGILQNLIKVDAGGRVNLKQTCQVAGLGSSGPGKPYRDGSFEYYIREPVVVNDYKGVGPFILASAEIENLANK
jgi:unsaturated rhamnogalacturonyl hydrolase